MIPRPIPTTNIEEFLHPVEVGFLKSVKSDLQMIKKAADYLSIRMLIDLMELAIALLCIGLDLEEFKAKYGIGGQFDEEIT